VTRNSFGAIPAAFRILTDIWGTLRSARRPLRRLVRPKARHMSSGNF
jgi:hypothetical protein